MDTSLKSVDISKEVKYHVLSGTNAKEAVFVNKRVDAIEQFSCFVPEKIIDVMKALDAEYPSYEFSILTKCKYNSEDRSFYLLEDIFVPNQEVTAGAVDYAPGEDYGEFNCVIHKHPNNCMSFSSTDETYINQNFDYSLLWVNSKFHIGIINIRVDQLDCRIRMKLNPVVAPVVSNVDISEYKEKIKVGGYFNTSLYNSNRSSDFTGKNQIGYLGNYGPNVINASDKGNRSGSISYRNDISKDYSEIQGVNLDDKHDRSLFIRAMKQEENSKYLDSLDSSVNLLISVDDTFLEPENLKSFKEVLYEKLDEDSPSKLTKKELDSAYITFLDCIKNCISSDEVIPLETMKFDPNLNMGIYLSVLSELNYLYAEPEVDEEELLGMVNVLPDFAREVDMIESQIDSKDVDIEKKFQKI